MKILVKGSFAPTEHAHNISILLLIFTETINRR